MNGVKDLPPPSGKTHLNSVMGLIASTLKKKDNKTIKQDTGTASDKAVASANLAKIT